jgi:ankyrin repeat protein
VNAQGGHFGNALQASCYLGNDVIAEKLLESGADINAFGGEYGSALQAAAAKAYGDARLPILLSNGAEVNQRGGVYGYYGTPLQAAAARMSVNDVDQVILLLDHGADVNTEGGHYGIALVAACSHWHHEGFRMALVLLRRGASVHAQGGHFGSAWHTAAARRGRGWEDVLQRMLDGGVDVNNAQGRHYPTALEAALAVSGKELPDPFAEDWGGADTDRIRFLLDRGADVNVRGGQYGFPLQAACCEQAKSCTHLDRCFTGVKFLLDNCPDIDVNAQGGEHETALQAAAYWGQTRSVKALLQHGADVNLRGGKCQSALNAAIIRHFWNIFEILLQAGATPDCQMLSEPDGEWLALVREEEGLGAVERYHLVWEKHKST